MATPDQFDSRMEKSDQPTQRGYASARPQLGVGSGGPDVAELAQLLAAAGYPNPIAEGLAPAVLDDRMMRLVRDFQEAHDIDPGTASDGAALPQIPRDHAGIVDAATWDALGGRQEVTR